MSQTDIEPTDVTFGEEEEGEYEFEPTFLPDILELK